MSRNICKILLSAAIALLVLMDFLSPPDCSYALLGNLPWLSMLLSVVTLVGMAAFLSYMNRSIFLVSSDRFTLPLIFVLISLSDDCLLVFSAHHIVASLTMASLFFILRFIVSDRMSKSDYFLWCILVSCSAAFVPQLIWLLLPGFFIAAGKSSEGIAGLVLITLGATCIPLIYISSYMFVFTGEIWYGPALKLLKECILLRMPRGISPVMLFYSLVMVVVIISSVVSMLKNYESIRNTGFRKQSRFIFPYFALVCLILVAGDVNTGLIMVFAIPWSLLFLFYGELNGYGRGWRHLVLLMSVSTVVFRAFYFNGSLF